MGKVLKGLVMAAAFVGLAFATGGASILAAGATAGAGAITVAGVTFAAGLGTALFGMAVASVLTGITGQLFSPSIPKTQLARLNVSLDPSTPRKSVFGTTALNLDLRYHETSGTNQEYVDYIICTSAHKITSIDEIWFDDKKAWDASSGVTSTYSGYLTVATRTEGTSANTIAINGGGTWGSSRRLTGCSYVHLRIKRTGATSKVESPLVSGLPSRVTIRGNGALLYDPRKDSTVTGGSGSHRANDQTTWGSYTDPDDCDNPALQLLWWLLGWKINGVLSVGCGVPYTRIDMPSFITAANICDENVTLAAGGTQKRYRTSGTASDNDDRREIINTFLMCMNGTLRDNQGKLTLEVIKNDLADYTLSFDDDDILDSFEWNQTRGLTETYNVARGRYVDPSDNSLYQLVDYPEVRIASPDGIERVATIDLPYVEEGRRAQRIAKQVLQRNQYRGMFTATFTAKAMGCQVGDVVRLSFTPLGWTNKLFRVVSQQIDFSGRVPLALIEENAAIYAWDTEEQAVVTPTAPTVYNPLNNPFILGISDAEALADGKITTFYQTSAPTAEGVGDIWFDTDDGNKMYRWNGVGWVTAQDTLITTAISDAADAQATADGKVQTFYATTAPTASAVGDLWIDSDDSNKLYRWNGSSWLLVRDSGIAQAIAAAATAQATADGKIDSFYQNTMPTTGTIGDFWIDTDDGNKLYRHNGTTFVDVQDDGITQAISDAAGAQATADGKVTTFYTTSTPTAEGVGDLWYNSTNSQLKRWNGSAWVDVADITANVIPRHEPADTSTAFTANYQGIIDSGQLPRTVQITRYRGATDVSASSTTWTIVSQGGIIDGTVTVSNGVVTIPSGVTIPSSTEIVVKSTRDSFDLVSKISVTRLDAAPPNTGSGGTTVNDSSFNTVNSTTLTAISDIMTVKTGASGQIVFSAPLNIYADAASPQGTFGAIGQWKYRPISGSFSNAGSQADDDFGAFVYYDSEFLSYFSYDGYISISATVTGLSANTDYEVQLYAARDSSSPTKTIYFGGTASATGS